MRSVVSFGNPADPCGRSRGFASPPCGGFALVVETGLVPRLFLCCNLSVSIGLVPRDLSLIRGLDWPFLGGFQAIRDETDTARS